MFHIERFTLNHQKAELSIISAASKVNSGEAVSLTYEFVRVMSPQAPSGKQAKAPISHKKQVTLIAIESVAKHGYRFIFDDQHNAIYSESYLQGLCQRQTELWQQYLVDLQASGHSREAMIAFTQV